jgi:hypothetical protein
MNAPLETRPFAPMPPAPRKYLVSDIFFLLEAGLLNESAKFELVDGEIIPMSPKGSHHEAMRLLVARWLRGAWADRFDSLQEHTLKIDDGTFLEPDFVLFDSGRDLAKKTSHGPGHSGCYRSLGQLIDL